MIISTLRVTVRLVPGFELSGFTLLQMPTLC